MLRKAPKPPGSCNGGANEATTLPNESVCQLAGRKNKAYIARTTCETETVFLQSNKIPSVHLPFLDINSSKAPTDVVYYKMTWATLTDNLV